MTPDALRTRGFLLYGRQWQKPMAKNVGVSEQTVRNWLDGTHKIKIRHQNKIEQLLLKHDRMIRAILGHSPPQKLAEEAKEMALTS
jgi:hypothetical protein